MIAFSIGKAAAATAASTDKSAIGLWNGSSPTVPVKILKIVATITVDSNEQYPLLKGISDHGTRSSVTALAGNHLWTVDKTFNITGISLDSTYTGEPTKNSEVLYADLLTSGYARIEWCFGSGLWIPAGFGIVVESNGSQGIKAGRWTFYGEV